MVRFGLGVKRKVFCRVSWLCFASRKEQKTRKETAMQAH